MHRRGRKRRGELDKLRAVIIKELQNVTLHKDKIVEIATKLYPADCDKKHIRRDVSVMLSKLKKQRLIHSFTPCVYSKVGKDFEPVSEDKNAFNPPTNGKRYEYFMLPFNGIYTG